MPAGPRRVERAETGLTTAHHQQLQISILPSSTLFVAGQAVHGIVELACSSSRLRLADVSLELVGHEELTSLDHTATQTFHKAHVYFQSQHTPPSNAVDADQPCLAGYWVARQGKTRFQFSFKLPDTLPSSASFAGNAQLRYTLKACAQVQYNSERSNVMRKVDVHVVEKLADWQDDRYWQVARAEASDRQSGGGSVSIEASLYPSIFWKHDPLDQMASSARGVLPIQVTVRNSTKKHLSDLKIQVVRRLQIPSASVELPPGALPAPQVTELAVDDEFRGKEYDFPAGCCKQTAVEYQIPSNLFCTRGTKLFDVNTILRVILKIGSPIGLGSKELAIELPIWLFHPASIPREAIDYSFQTLAPQNISPLRSPSTRPHSAHPRALSPMQAPPQSAYAPLSPQHFSPNGVDPLFSNYSPTPWSQHAVTPNISTYQQPSYQPAFSTVSPQQGFSLPYSASSPALYNQSQVHHPPDWRFQPLYPSAQPQYIDFDAARPIASPSNFVNQDYAISRPQEDPYFPSVPMSADPALSRSWSAAPTAPAAYHKPVPQAHYRPSTTPWLGTDSQADFSIPDRPTSARGDRSVSAPEHERSPSRAATALPEFEGLTELERQQIQANVEPLRYSGVVRANMTREQLRDSMKVRRMSAPQLGETVSRATPPPPSPSSRFLPPEGETRQTDSPSLLDTIGEDGESQAGTLRNPAALAALLRDDAPPMPEIQSCQASRPALIRGSSAANLEELVEQPDFKLEEQEASEPPPVPSARTKPTTLTTLPAAMDIFPRAETTADVPSEKISTTMNTLAPKATVDEEQQKNNQGRRPSLDTRSTLEPVQKARPLIPKSKSEAGLASLEQRLSRPTSPLTEITPSQRPTALPKKMKPVSAGALRAKSSSISLKEHFDLSSSIEQPKKPASNSERPRTMSDISKVTPPVKEPSLEKVAKWLDRSSNTASPVPDAVSYLLLARSTSPDAISVHDSISQFVKPQSQPKRHISPPAGSRPILQDKLPSLPDKPARITAPKHSLSLPAVPTTFTPSKLPQPSKPRVATVPTTTVLSLPLYELSPPPSPPDDSKSNSGLNDSVLARKSQRAAALSTQKIADFTKAVSAGKDQSPADVLSGKRRTSLREDDETDKPKYDVKSARGGRGGVVTSVAGLWSGKIASEEASKVPVPRLPIAKSQALLIDPHNTSAALRPTSPESAHPRVNLRALRDLMAQDAAVPKSKEDTTPPLLTSTQTKPNKEGAALAGKRRSFGRPDFNKGLSAPAYLNTTLAKFPAMSAPSVLAQQKTSSHGHSSAGLKGLIAKWDQSAA